MTGAPSPSGSLRRRLFRRPVSQSGKRSLRALLWFAAALGVFFVAGIPVLSAIRAIDIDALTIAWYVVMFAMLGVAGLIALASLGFALHGMIRQGDRSLVLLAPVLLGIFVTVFAVGEAFGHDEPGDDEPGGASGHANARAEETAPGIVRVTFEYTFGGSPAGARITANTLTPLDSGGRPLDGLPAAVLPIERGTHQAEAEYRLNDAQLAALASFSLCFSDDAGATYGCTTVEFARR